MAWIKVATTDQLADDEALPVQLGERQLAVFKSQGEFHVTDNVCTHQYALLSDGWVEDGCVECPLHQARFDLATGEAKCAPATEPIRVYPVRVEGDDVLADA